MTIDEFNEYLKCGLGRCVQFLGSCKDREPYRPSVLNVCLNNPCYDTQSEGTRDEYIYRLASLYNDDDYFVTRIIEKMWRVYDDTDWDFAHLLDLCWQFAVNGNGMAENAVREAYTKLYAVLLERAGMDGFDGYDGARDSFERVCGKFLYRYGAPAYESIIFDLGELFLRGKRYSADDFDWFIFCLYEDFGRDEVRKFLKATELTSPAVREFREQAERVIAEFDRLRNSATGGENWARRKRALEEERNNITARERAEIRAVAIALLESGENIGEAIEKLVQFYEPTDGELLIDSLYKMEIDVDEESGWHGAMLEILRRFDDGVDLPREALEFIYERSHCSGCRERAVLRMDERRWLTDEMKRECLYDSNSDIVDYIKKYFKK